MVPPLSREGVPTFSDAEFGRASYLVRNATSGLLHPPAAKWRGGVSTVSFSSASAWSPVNNIIRPFWNLQNFPETILWKFLVCLANQRKLQFPHSSTPPTWQIEEFSPYRVIATSKWRSENKEMERDTSATWLDHHILHTFSPAVAQLLVDFRRGYGLISRLFRSVDGVSVWVHTLKHRASFSKVTCR